MKIFKKLGVPAVALAGLMMIFAPSPASARVHVGVAIGTPYYYPYGYAYPYGYGVHYGHHHWRHHHGYWYYR